MKNYSRPVGSFLKFLQNVFNINWVIGRGFLWLAGNSLVLSTDFTFLMVSLAKHMVLKRFALKFLETPWYVISES